MTAVNRRRMLGMLLALSALPYAGYSTAAGARVDVVKIMSFSCPVCLAAEAQDRAIAQAVEAHGGQFVRAPVPTGEDDSGTKEIFYYASREKGARLSDAVKDALYKGSQDVVVPLNDLLSVHVWLQRELPDKEAELAPVFELAQQAAARKALSRAVALANQAGVQALPSYVFVVNGRVQGALDPSLVPSGTLLALKDEVVRRIAKLTS